MGYGDREYMDPGYPAGRPPGHFAGAPVAKFLVLSNIVIFLIGVLLTPEGSSIFYETTLKKWGKFTIVQGILGFQFWRMLTFQFLHADFFHLFSNMIGMFFFAPHVERWMGSRPFIFYYLFCGIAGALFYTLLYFLPGFFDGEPIWRGMVGASAGLFGILAAFYKIAPNAKILLMFFIPMKVRTAAILFFIYEVINLLSGGFNAGGSAGHLGGALLGLSFIKFKPLRSALIHISALGTAEAKSKKAREAKVVRERKRAPISSSEEVDRILEKISAHGIQSLTDKERKTLDQARR